MSEFLGEVADDIAGVAETAVHAGEAVYDGATGDWDGAADSSLSMSEAAIGVATGGISEVAAAGWDAIADETGLPTAHEALHDATETAGNAVGDAMFGLVGDEHAHASAVDFDNGDYLAGVGEMAEGAGETIANAASDAASSAYDTVSDAASDAVDYVEDLF